jgi:hypothetical protein
MTITPPPSDPTPATPGVPAGWYDDSTTGRMRWWNGAEWTNDFAPAAPAYPVTPVQPAFAIALPYGVARASNGPAVASLVLGIIAFFLTPIPLFIGLFFGGIPAVLAVILGVVGINRAGQTRTGLPMAVIGLCLGGFEIFLVFLGAGTIW